MRIRVLVAWLVVSASLAVGAASPLAAQSLADLARQEEARRKAIKEPSRVFTNKDLPAVPAPAAPAPDEAAADQGAKAAPAAADGAAKDSAAAKSDTADAAARGGAAAKDEAAAKAGRTADQAPGATKAKDQAYWSGRLKQLQSQLDRDRLYADAVQTRINVLTADFSARDDPAQRAQIERDRQKALAELDRLKKAIEADQAAIVNLQEEARRASVPPGWLR